MSDADLVEVALLGFPLPVYGRALEHSTELMREFSLIALGQAEADSPIVPVRLLTLVDKLTRDYAGIADAADTRRDEALEAGLPSVDLTYLVPRTAADACHALAEVLDEADKFCESGDALLTLTSSPEARAFRDWYFGEFITQIAGGRPTPWPEYAPAAVG